MSNATSLQSYQSPIHLLVQRGGGGGWGVREGEGIRADSLSAHDKRTREDDERDNRDGARYVCFCAGMSASQRAIITVAITKRLGRFEGRDGDDTGCGLNAPH